MTKYYCDRCGCRIYSNSCVVDVTAKSRSDDLDVDINLGYELCPICIKELHDWIIKNPCKVFRKEEGESE